MNQSNKNHSCTTYSSISCQISKGISVVALVLLLFVNPNTLVSARISTQEAQNLPSQTYLPIVSGSNGAFYVSTQGNDANPGTILRPWRTIGKAASMVEPGDTVYIRNGIYHEQVHFNTSGTESNPIRISAFPGENPIMDGENTIPGPGGWMLNISANYVYASGLEIRNSAYGGILIYGDNNNVTNMYVHHGQENGILIYKGHNSIVENSHVWRNALTNEYGQGGTWSSGLTIAGEGGSYNTLRHNTVWENWGEGISTGGDHDIIEDNITHDNYSANIYLSDATNILCQRNFVYTDPTSYVFSYGNNVGIMLGDEKYDPPSSNITIINNISSGNHNNLYWWQGVQGGGMNNVLIANNTFVNSIGVSGVVIQPGTHQNVRFMNNLTQQDGSLPVIIAQSNPELHFSNNLWSKTPPPAASGPGDIITDPLFAHIGNPYMPEWFTLTDLSPAINNALSLLEVNVDFFQLNRGAPPDIGANEFFSTP
jgi:hypothetical protein